MANARLGDRTGVTVSAAVPTAAPRLLALVGNGHTSLQVKAQLEDLKKSLIQLSPGSDPVLVDSSTWYKTAFPRCGSWDSWIWETVTGKDYNTRKPHFSGFIVTEVPLGKANAGIVRLALRNGSPVLCWQEQAGFEVVTDVVEGPQEDWGAKWDVVTKPLGG